MVVPGAPMMRSLLMTVTLVPNRALLAAARE